MQFPSLQPENYPLYPSFLKLGGRRVVLVGGGPVAVSKFAGLQAAGAEVVVVAPRMDPSLRAAAVVHERAFAPGDLDGAWFVVAAAPPEVNRQVLAAAEARRLFVNAVDDPAAATAYAAAVVRRGPVTVAVSTGGAAPALAGLLREALEGLLPDDLAAWAETATRVRREQRAAGVPMPQRRALLLDALVRLHGAHP